MRHNIKARVFFDGVCRLIYGDIEPHLEEKAAQQRPTGTDSHMATVCADLVREIRERHFDSEDGEAGYVGWLRTGLAEFRLASEAELQSWLGGGAPIGVPLDVFRRLLAAYDRAFGWELERDVLRRWAIDWDGDNDQRIRAVEVQAFVDGTSKASYTGTHQPQADPTPDVDVRFTVGDKFAEELVLKVVDALSADHTFSQGVAILQRAFDHPLVDPRPQQGAVAFHPFRRAMASAGVPIDYGEDEAGLGFFRDASDRLIDYVRFIQCVKRAWMASSSRQNGSITGSLELDVKLQALREELKKYVLSVGESDRFAPSKIFHRMDTNRDGKLSAAEFLQGVRTLKLRCDLSEAELQKIFDFFDDDHDGTIDYEEFYQFCVQGTVGNWLRRKNARELQYDSDSEGSVDGGFGASRVVSLAEADHVRAARNAVNRRWPTEANREKLRAYLRHKDHNNDGTVSEKVFLRFLKHAHVSENLTRRQLQALIQWLDERATHWIKYAPFVRECVDKPEAGAPKREDERKVVEPPKPAPAIRGDLTPHVLRHMIETVAMVQHTRGVHVHSMFVAHDPAGRGGVPPDTAMTILRNLGCEATDGEFEGVFARLSPRNDGLVDYPELAQLLGAVPPLVGGGLWPPPGAAVAGPNGSLMGGSMWSLPPPTQNLSLTSPLSPYPPRPGPPTVSFARHPPPAAHGSAGASPYPVLGIGGVGGVGGDPAGAHQALAALAARVQRAVQDERAKWGHFSLRALFERAYDHTQQGVVTVADFQLALNQHLGLVLSALDLHAVRCLYERTTGPGFAAIDYIEFCRFVETDSSQLGHLVERIATALAEQRRRGLNLDLIFEMHDTGNAGFVSVAAFHDAVRQLGLPLAEAQTRTLAARFHHPTNPNLVNYLDFLAFVNRAAPSADLSYAYDRSGVDRSALGVSLVGGGGQMRSAYEDDLSPPSHGPMLGRQKSVDLDDRRDRDLRPTLDGPLALEHDRAVNWNAVDTMTPRPSGDRHGHATPRSLVPRSASRNYDSAGRFRADSGYGAATPSSPVRDQQRESAIKVWGAQTPIGSRGEVPRATQRRLDEQGKWMCLTCLYAGNWDKKANCEVCGASNPKGKTAQVMQECLHCHFNNSEFAETCSMCGKRLFPTGGVGSSRGGDAPLALPPSEGGWRQHGSRDLSDDEGYAFGGRD